MTDEGYDLFSFDYRGYGISEGQPSQEGVNQDALAAIHYVAGQTKQKLILYGQSLGGAILLRSLDDVPAADRARIKAVVIESSFYSYHAIARDVLLGTGLLFCFSRWPTFWSRTSTVRRTRSHGLLRFHYW